jgi:hypothetical protein
MHDRFTLITALWIALILAGCSNGPSPINGTWTAAPEFREVNNSFCQARLTPQKDDRAYYSFFLLTLVNRSDEDLVFDWNASRYLFDGKPKGALVFAGIDPEAVKNGTIPIETVPPGGRLERILMPKRLITWNSIQHQSPGNRGITPGLLPAGDNGVLLSFRQAGVRVTMPLSVSIALEPN